MQKSILIKNTAIVSSEKTIKADLLIKGGKVHTIADRINEAVDLEIDGTDLYLMPGVIDSHVHFREPGLEWKENLESGSKAAAAGGVTSFFDMPNTKPATVTLETLKEKKELAAKKSLINYNFFIGATPDNLEILNQAKNIPGVKLFMGASIGSLLVDQLNSLEKIFAEVKHLIVVHAEDEELLKKNKATYSGSTDVLDHMKIRSSEVAFKATKQAVELALKHDAQLHIAHVSTAEEVSYLKENKSDLISAEVCPQHLFLHAPEIYKQLNCRAQMNPPIRTIEHSKALWSGLKDGILDFVATDHAPHTIEEKDQEFGKAPSGVPGVETSLPLFLDQVSQGNCSINNVVNWMCESPAKRFKMKNKGFIAEGFDADLVLIDFKKTKELTDDQVISKSGWSPFSGKKITGWPVTTIVNGNIVYQEGEFFTDIKGKEIQIEQN